MANDRFHVAPLLSTLAELKAIRHERGDRSPFKDQTEFLRWADKVEPLLAFDVGVSDEFRGNVRSVKMLVGWRVAGKYDGAVSEAIGTVNKAIALLELTLKAAADSLSPSARGPASVVPLPPPESVTLKWLFAHATWSVYAMFLGSLAVSFGIGRELGKLETQIQSSSLSKPALTNAQPTSSVNSGSELTKPEAKSNSASTPK
jgi:hypothetical protein